MKKKFDNILLIILWLLAMCLGTCFWLNTRYGFNMFYGPHWEYLSYAQASNLNINKWFYVSIVVAIVITIIGLYLIVTPNILSKCKRFKNIKTANEKQSAQPTNESQAAAINEPVRPPRPNTPIVVNSTPINPVKTEPTNIAPTQMATTPQYTDELKQIFQDAGFVVKQAPIINGVQTSLFAAGTGEVVYIGATGITHDKMQSAIDKLRGVFSDTLDDIEININAFIVSPLDNSDNDSIIDFATIDDLREYIQAHTNPPLPDDDDGNFDAFSSFITTVAEYIGNI
ncbi:MAG: hypothetical protein MJ170_00700 [Alphaproteobacteria bacterium]|nr:hypothetical protein [Alphaproteobacteria bacterium]